MTFSFTGRVPLIKKILAMIGCLNQSELTWHRVLMLSKETAGTPSANKKKEDLGKVFKRVDDCDFHGIEHDNGTVVLYAGFIRQQTSDCDTIAVLVKFDRLVEGEPLASVKVNIDTKLTKAKITTARMLALLLAESEFDGFLDKAKEVGTYLVSLTADTRHILM